MVRIHRIPSTKSLASDSDLGSLRSFSAADLRSLPACCAPRAPSLRLSAHATPQATVLRIGIRLHLRHQTLPAARVGGERVLDFYARAAAAAAAANGSSRAKVCGYCCVCVGTVPAPTFAPTPADPRADQAARTLAFAAALHRAPARVAGPGRLVQRQSPRFQAGTSDAPPARPACRQPPHCLAWPPPTRLKASEPRRWRAPADRQRALDRRSPPCPPGGEAGRA